MNEFYKYINQLIILFNIVKLFVHDTLTYNFLLIFDQRSRATIRRINWNEKIKDSFQCRRSYENLKTLKMHFLFLVQFDNIPTLRSNVIKKTFVPTNKKHKTIISIVIIYIPLNIHTKFAFDLSISTPVQRYSNGSKWREKKKKKNSSSSNKQFQSSICSTVCSRNKKKKRTPPFNVKIVQFLVE